jgi:hypothetical protein
MSLSLRNSPPFLIFFFAHIYLYIYTSIRIAYAHDYVRRRRRKRERDQSIFYKEDLLCLSLRNSPPFLNFFAHIYLYISMRRTEYAHDYYTYYDDDEEREIINQQQQRGSPSVCVSLRNSPPFLNFFAHISIYISMRTAYAHDYYTTTYDDEEREIINQQQQREDLQVSVWCVSLRNSPPFLIFFRTHHTLAM